MTLVVAYAPDSRGGAVLDLAVDAGGELTLHAEPGGGTTLELDAPAT